MTHGARVPLDGGPSVRPRSATAADAADAWSDATPPCPPLETYAAGANPEEWSARVFGQPDAAPAVAPYAGTLFRPSVHGAYCGRENSTHTQGLEPPQGVSLPSLALTSPPYEPPCAGSFLLLDR